MSYRPKLMQFLVAASTQFAAFSVGAAITFPTLLMDQFQLEDSSHLDMDTRSWIGSIHGLAGIPAIIMPIIIQRIGRKLGFMITCVILMTGWILAYTAKTAAQILISESFLGLGCSSATMISFMSLTEMLAPEYRHVSMQMFSVTIYTGMGVGGILGRYLHYTTVSLIMLTSICITFILTTIWPESPYWLACRGEFKKCERVFIKLRGDGEKARKELKELIAAQTENLSSVKVKKRFTCERLWADISSRDFYMSSLHCFVLLLVVYWSGSSVILIYFIEIVTKMINDQTVTNYSSVVMYLVSFVGSILTTFLVTRFNNKTVILYNACGIVGCLFGSFVVTGLQSLGVLAKDSYFLMYFMIGFTACNGMSTVFLVSAEVVPVRHRSIGGALQVIYNCILQTSSLKSSPYLFSYIGYCGTFLIYTLNATLCSLFIWKCVPETKGRTLQELEDYYMHGSFVKRNCDDEKVKSEELRPLGPNV